jgi:glutamate-1-semialdehyde aminotransferase
LQRAWKVIPSATQTFSKGPNQWVKGVSPAYLEHGKGAWVWDVDGNKFLDYLMALGPIILGYGDAAVNKAIKEQVDKGQVFSQMNPLEVEVAEKLVELIPCAEMVRFAKNGSDATTGAIRAARAFTRRDHVICCGYHGWHDWYIGTTTRNAGVPQAVQDLTHAFSYNDLATLRLVFKDHPDDIAAVIMEPVGIEMPDDGFLEGVRDLTHENGALLIFDEIINGFRLAFGGSQEMLGVKPDLAAFGKAMANGMPLSVVVGRRDVMEGFDEIFFSGTFGGDTVALAACRATIAEMERRDVIGHIWDYGRRLSAGIRNLIDQYALGDALELVGYDARSILAFPHADEEQSRLRRSYFMQECHKRGLLFFGPHLPTAAHGDTELDFTLKVYDEVMSLFAVVYQADDFARRMEGEIVEPIFREP